MSSSLKAYVALWTLCLAVISCGGGGGSGGGSSPGAGTPVTPPSTPIVNQAPVADAGQPQSVASGATVTLSASASTDANGDSLQYEWVIVSRPSGSNTTLSSISAVAPSFVADQPGSYVFKLTVSDGRLSSTATVTITVSSPQTNVPPVAHAGAAQNVVTGSTVTLDGRASSDADGTPLSYAWSFTTKPNGSTATLSNPSSAQPQFVADVSGTYTLGLSVSDGSASSSASVNITAAAANVAPVAQAGSSRTVLTGSLVTLNGSASSDTNGDALSYSWSLLSKPSGSTASLSSAQTATPAFTPDLAGTYVAQLIVSDGLLSATATVNITAVVPDSTAPIATTDSAITAYQTALSGIDVLANDSDDSGQKPSLTGQLSSPSNGSFTVNAGKIDFTPNTGFSGTASVSYEIQDASGNKAWGQLNVTVKLPVVVTTLQVGVQSNTTIAVAIGVNKAAQINCGYRLATAAAPSVTDMQNGNVCSASSTGTALFLFGGLSPGANYVFYLLARGNDGSDWQSTVTAIPFTMPN